MPINNITISMLIDFLENAIIAIKQSIELLKSFDNFHPRAVKLLMKKKPFIVIAIDEPYFVTAYRMIRENEICKGRWTNEDELQFIGLTQQAIYFREDGKQ